MSANTITDSIFESISLIVEKHIANLDFDKTIICTVVDTTNAEKKNEYTVSDGSSRFIAYGNGGTYEVDDQVRVVIPKNNFAEQKYIQGKYSAEEVAKPITYVSPLGSVLQTTDNLFTPSSTSLLGIAANGGEPLEVLLGTMLFDEDLRHSDLHDTIYLSAEFQTGFEQVNMVEGDYGLHIVIALEKVNSEDEPKTDYDRIDLYFSALNNMYGNPYAFRIFTKQEIKYNFSQLLDDAVGAQIYLYQKNNFKYLDATDTLCNYTPSVMNDGTVLSDIKVKNIVFGFGSEVSNVDQNQLKLYTNDETEYRSNDATLDNRDLQLLWYNKSENNEYIGFSDGEWSESEDNKGVYHYDEEEYLAEVALNSRLLARRTDVYPDDEMSLTLAADAHDIFNTSTSLSKLVGQDLYQTFQGFYKWTIGMAWPNNQNPFNTLLSNNPTNSLGAYSKKLTDLGTEVFNDYDTTLKLAKKAEKTTDTIDPDNNAFIQQQNLISTIITASNTACTIVQDLLTTYPSYQSVYDTYKERIDKIIEKIDYYNSKLSDWHNKTVFTTDAEGNVIETKTTNTAILNDYRINGLSEDIIAYVDKTTQADFQKKWDNKYCLYWYRYDENYSTPDRFTPPHWERLNEQTNSGLPGKSDKVINDVAYLEKKTNQKVTVGLRQELDAKQEEKYMVVLFKNHQKFISNELVFTNLYQVPDRTTIDAEGALSIEHNNDASQDSYQLYGSNGLLLNAAEAQTSRKLRARFNSSLGGDEQLIDAKIYWYIPANATMLTVFDNELKNLGFSSDRVVYYANTDSYNAAEESGQLSSLTVNVIGPSGTGTYSFCSYTEDYKSYKEADNVVIYHSISSSFTDTNKTYLIKTKNSFPYEYEVYTYNTETEDWIKKETINKFNNALQNASVPIYSLSVGLPSLPTKESVPEGSTFEEEVNKYINTECLLGPNSEDNNTYSYYKVKAEYDDDGNVESLQWEDTGTKINNLTLTLFGTLDYKPGYYCYHKTIGIQLNGSGEPMTNENGHQKLNEADTIFPYHIKDYYQQTATQNSILCVVKKAGQTHQTAKHLSFSSYGTNGTDYTLALTPNAQFPMVTDIDTLFVNTTLYDQEHSEILISDDDNNLINSVKYEWIGPHSGYQEPVVVQNNGILSGCTITKKPDEPKYAGILQCSIAEVKIEQLGKKINLQSQLAIPYSINQGYYIDGASAIIYDSNGTNPDYYKKPYVLYNSLTDTEENGITWYIEYYSSDGKQFTITGNELKFNDGTIKNLSEIDAAEAKEYINQYSLNYLPRLNQDNIIVPSPMYLSYTQYAKQVYPVVIAKKGNTVYWAQPILITQNTYSSSVINEWDGSLKIDDENGTILSTMVGAGRKNDNNEFEGVLMGDVATGSGDDAIVVPGLYGFHGGAQSFGFKIDGTAFLGKTGCGQISFNGNSGTITSGNYEKRNVSDSPPKYGGGMEINLSEGTIDAYNFALTGTQTTGSASGSFVQISSEPNNFLTMHYQAVGVDVDVLTINTDNYYLHSFDWLQNEQGTEIDLANGRWLSFCNTGSYDGKGILLNANDTTYPLLVGGSGNYSSMYENATFKVKWDGSLYLGSNFQVDNTGKLTTTGAQLIDLTVTNDAQFNGSINSTGNADFGGTANFGGDTYITGTLESTGAATFGGNTQINGTITTTGQATLGGDTSIDGMCTITTGLKINTPNLSVGDAVAVSGHHTILVDQPWQKGIELEFANGILIRYGDVEGGKVDESWNNVASVSALTEVSNRVTTLETNYNSFFRIVSTLGENYNNLTTIVTDLVKDYNTLSDTVTTLESRITALEALHSAT